MINAWDDLAIYSASLVFRALYMSSGPSLNDYNGKLCMEVRMACYDLFKACQQSS